MGDLAKVRLVVDNNKEEQYRMADYLKLVTGGKELPPNGDWLSLLDVDTVFLVKDKRSPSFALGHFKILDKTEGSKTVFLGSTNPQMPPMIPVEPVRFCQQYSLHEVICITDADLVPDPVATDIGVDKPTQE